MPVPVVMSPHQILFIQPKQEVVVASKALIAATATWLAAITTVVKLSCCFASSMAVAIERMVIIIVGITTS